MTEDHFHPNMTSKLQHVTTAGHYMFSSNPVGGRGQPAVAAVNLYKSSAIVIEISKEKDLLVSVFLCGNIIRNQEKKPRIKKLSIPQSTHRISLKIWIHTTV